MRLGILPAAGKADRWGGYPKELLPISTSDTFMSRAVRTLHSTGCDFVLVITNPAKIHLHSYHLKEVDHVLYALQHGDGMWGAMRTAISTSADEYFFMMPDTFLPPRPLPHSLTADFVMGIFQTDQPERYGVLSNGEVINKQPADIPAPAWGTLAWSSAVAEYWRNERYPNYTEAINDAIRNYGFAKWELDYYFDIGSMESYAEFLLSGVVDHSTVIEVPQIVDVNG